MLIRFFEVLREHRVPVSVREFLDLQSLLAANLAFADHQAFYFLSRLCLVKDERYYDRFDKAFAALVNGISEIDSLLDSEEVARILTDRLRRLPLNLSDREFTQLIEEARKAEVNNKVVTEGQSPWEISVERNHPRPDQDVSGETDVENDGGDEGDGEGNGEGNGQGQGEGDGEGDGDGDGDGDGNGGEGQGEDGTSGEGKSDQGESGIATEDNENSQRRADKVWEARLYEDYDPDVEIGTRNLKMALRRLRKMTRDAADLELDLHATIHDTARNGGLLSIREVPERHNAVKVLLLLDVGGSMDDHIELCGQLFSATRTEFKYLEFFYFHNVIYDCLWPSNERRHDDRTLTYDLMRKFGRDYKVIVVGDARMGRHEVTEKGGCVERYNAETGETWLLRLQDHFSRMIWLNPYPEVEWSNSDSTVLLKRLMEDHMYHLSTDGLEKSIKYLMR